ncbi:hypothetical protein JCM33374_g5467 [Metschnikowia sp. JCM 33374]|nr:hypothetical protein JCM33374_g5467 [Metschnikowia sp. JCM 33374]
MSGNSGIYFEQALDEPWDIINLNECFEDITREDEQEGDPRDLYYESDDSSTSDSSSISSAELREIILELRRRSLSEDMDLETEQEPGIFTTNIAPYFSDVRDQMLPEVFLNETNRVTTQAPFEVRYYNNTFHFFYNKTNRVINQAPVEVRYSSNTFHFFYNERSTLEVDGRSCTCESEDSDPEASLYSEYYEAEYSECGCCCAEGDSGDLAFWSQHEEITALLASLNV